MSDTQKKENEIQNNFGVVSCKPLTVAGTFNLQPTFGELISAILSKLFTANTEYYCILFGIDDSIVV